MEIDSGGSDTETGDAKAGLDVSDADPAADGSAAAVLGSRGPSTEASGEMTSAAADHQAAVDDDGGDGDAARRAGSGDRTSRAAVVDGKGGAATPVGVGDRTPRALLRRWAPRVLTVAAVLAALMLVLGGIGGQLAGRTVLADTDAMAGHGPYADAGSAGITSANLDMSDVYSAELPSTILFKNTLATGHLAQWDPYIAAGTPLGSITNNALLSPLTAPYYVLPAWLAPAYERLAEFVVGLTGCFLFLRRLKLSPPASIVGGTVYVASAFMVTWTGWPQTRVAAFIPLVFWAAERYLQERRFRDVAILGAVIGGFLLGGFPSVEGYTLLTLGCYSLTRLIAEHRAELVRMVKIAAGLGAGVAAGLGLAMFQVLPFAAFYKSWLIEGRGQVDTSHLDPVSLVTSFAPWAFGGVGSKAPLIYLLSQNPVESLSYLGAAALVLVLVAAAALNRGRALLPKGVWIFFVAATAAWVDLVYRGGTPLRLLQHLPLLRSLFGANFIGRARSMTGFLLPCLAAIGLELVLQRRREAEPGAVPLTPRARWWGRVWAGGLLGLVGVEAVRLVVHGHAFAVANGSIYSVAGSSAVAVFDHEVGIGALLGLLALACVAAIWYAGRRPETGVRAQAVRYSAATAVMFLIAGQGMQFVHHYTPAAPKSTFYPVTDTQEFLAANLGHERYASTVDGVVQGTDSVYALRSLNGHTFLNANLAALVRGMPDDPIPAPTHLAFADDPLQATSPVLDRLGIAYFAASPEEQVFGTEVPGATDGSTLTLQPGVAVTAPLPQSGRLRAVGFVPAVSGFPTELTAADPDSWVEVVVRDASGGEVASAKRLTVGMTAGQEFDIPVAADYQLPGSALTATVTLHTSAPVAVQARSGGKAAALSEVAGADDGLSLVYVGSSVIYQRDNALPRIRWASSAEVVPNEDDRISQLASGSLLPSTVVLNSPGPAAAGSPATVQVVSDGTDGVKVDVAAEGSGYLVVADADQVGWSATVDGKKAALVPADEAVVAVPVSAGKHIVALHYSSPDGNLGLYVSGATVCVLIAGVGFELWWTRRRLPAGPVGSAGLGAGAGLPSQSDQPGAGPREAALDKPERSGAPSGR